MRARVTEPLQVRAYDKLKKLLGGHDGRGLTPEDRYTLRILETRASQAAGRQAKKEKRARDPKGPQKQELKDLVAKLDHEFSRYIRGRDTKVGEDGDRRGNCVTCSSLHTYAEFDCGHWIPRRKGGKFATRWHVMNAHAQCVGCNKWGKGREPEHEQAIRRLHGQDIPERLQALHKFGPEPRRDEIEKRIGYFKEKADGFGVPP